MARNQWNQTNSVAVALSAGVPRTVLQLIAPSNLIEAIQEVAVSFDGISPTAVPITIQLRRQTTAPAGSSPRNPGRITVTGVNLQVTGIEAATGAEPVGSDILRQWFLHPQAGERSILPIVREVEFANGERVGLVCIAPAGVNVLAEIGGEE